MFKKCFIFFLFLSACILSFAQKKNLDYFIDSATINSPLLNDLRNQILSNRIDSQILIAANSIQVNANGNSFYAPIVNGWGYDAAITNGGQLQALITASKNILSKKFLNSQFKNLQLVGDSLNVAAKISEQDIKKIIISQYITAYGDQLQLDFNNQLISLLSKEEIILKKLTEKNVYKQVDYLSFLVTFQQQNLTRLQLDVQYKNDYATLNYLAGILDTTLVTLSEPALNAIRTFIPDSSVFFLKYRIDSLRLINNKSIINQNYQPHITAFADAGYQSSFMEMPYKNFGRSIGVNFIIPIYDGHQKKLQYSKIEIAERTRVRNKEFFQNQYYQQIAQLQQQLSSIENLLTPINKQIKYIETLINVNGKLLETGDIKMTDYVLSLNNYITAKNLVVQNIIARYQIINQLNYWTR
ncbi:MAG: TolC family protein [Bacteroidota bacterium]|nr:TolC family protein [Bacteroidota bacterium]